MPATIMIHAAGTSGQRCELPFRLSGMPDVTAPHTRFCARFPQLRELIWRAAPGDAEAAVTFIGRFYRVADPLLAVIPPGTETGYDSWCPRGGEDGMKYWERVPLSAMITTGYFNCLYGTALAAHALRGAGHGFSLLICPAVPTHPYLRLAARPGPAICSPSITTGCASTRATSVSGVPGTPRKR